VFLKRLQSSYQEGNFCRGKVRFRVETKTVFPFSRKAKMSKFSQNLAKFCFRKNFCLRENFCFPGSFRKNGYVSAINIFKMINSNGNLTILVHSHYCCPICFEAPSGFDNFEGHGGQYCCPICFEAPSGLNIYEVHGEYSCPICFEAPSGVQ
jgi:hypothetical protein